MPGLSLGNAQAADGMDEIELQAARDAAKIQIETLQAKIETNSELSKALGKWKREETCQRCFGRETANSRICSARDDASGE